MHDLEALRDPVSRGAQGLPTSLLNAQLPGCADSSRGLLPEETHILIRR